MSSFSALTSLSGVTEGILCPPFAWCAIQGGPVILENAIHYGGTQGGSFVVSDFWLARYPITNAQFDRFLAHAQGYADLRWWQYSSAAHQWRSDHPHAQPTAFEGDNLPRTRVSWFDCQAFCAWLSAQLTAAGSPAQVYLPTEQEWQRAALGDTGWQYPWGDELDETRANYGHLVGSPSAVDSYPQGQSVYSVYDLVGNVWEWCQTAWGGEDREQPDDYAHRAIRGGAWNVSNPEYLRPADRGGHPPRGRLNDCGFRIACTL